MQAKFLLILAALAMFLPIAVMQYIGEESYYTLSAYEIFVTGDWWHQSIFGLYWPKTPLYNWLIIAAAQVVGWEHLEIAARFVSVAATLGSASFVFLMAKRLFGEAEQVPFLAASIYLTMGEISFWYGWLGYADATFGFFIFAALACLWISIEDNKLNYFIYSLLLISMAFMVKNISCYALYGMAGFILLWRLQRWQLLKQPLFLLSGIAALMVPWLYQHLALNAGSNSTIAIGDALRNFAGYSLADYLKHWISYPALFIGRAFPVTLLLIWFYWRHKQRYSMSSPLITLTWILLAWLAPFWLSAAGTPRYLVPMYGLLALLLTGLSLQLGREQLQTVLKAMLIIIILKVPYSLGILPYIKDWRPERDLNAVAEEILQLTRDHTVRTRDDVSTGLSIGAYMDVRIPPEKYIRWYDGREHQVFVLCDFLDPKLGELKKSWRLRGDDVHLYWQP
ncbi:MAG TPA: glycosyltransferase family 39 protein [Mariprofundaceae bacterium]|nr:glycosyltransferase family 39 protein [Mariprofundaceae bacterium]